MTSNEYMVVHEAGLELCNTPSARRILRNELSSTMLLLVRIWDPVQSDTSVATIFYIVRVDGRISFSGLSENFTTGSYILIHLIACIVS